ncbi:MAG: hypothetical protein AUK54_02040 [Helicobacteraceae bacterium CG2_30_36_10]|nr:MAG: hypothetical protein AUK54_02040 [Helicobacteraceae bacterium CG2_30_36_10]
MIRLLFIGLLFFITLRADFFAATDDNQSHVVAVIPKVLYLSFKEIPTRILQGEIFSVTIKTLSTIKDFKDIKYELLNYRGIEPLNYSLPYREIDSKYYYDTFYFLLKESSARLPDFTATLVSEDETEFKQTTLLGKELNVVTLNPKKDFSNIIADSFELLEYKTTSYDKKHNIVLFVVAAKNCDIKSFHLNGVYKQGAESQTESIFESKLTYYAVIDKEIQNFSFSYFNSKKNRFDMINIPIIVDDDSVTTQSDLKPTDQSKELLKMTIAAGVGILGFVFILFRRKYIYLVFVVIPLIYIAYIGMPQKDVCIKQGADIYLLPVYNGTIFETTEAEIYLQKEGNIKGFVKVKLQNEKIGWVKNEDICSY